MQTEKETCLRCGKEYEYRKLGGKYIKPDFMVPDYDNHICTYDQEKQQIIDTGINGKVLLSPIELKDFIRDYKHLYAGAASIVDNKKLLVSFMHRYWVYHKNELLYEGHNRTKAVEVYNEIKLSVL